MIKEREKKRRLGDVFFPRRAEGSASHPGAGRKGGSTEFARGGVNALRSAINNMQNI